MALRVVDRYIKWLIEEIGYYNNYHNHKETMAWVATAFYVPAVVTFGYYGSQFITNRWELIVALLVVGITALFILFLHFQFRSRHEAHLIIVGLMRLVARLSSTGRVSRLVQTAPNANQNEHPEWPSFIRDEINWPVSWWHRLWSLRKFGGWQTEIPSYFVVILATAISIILLVVN